MRILIRMCLYKSEPKLCTMSGNHSLPIKCLSFSPLDPLSTLFHSPVCTEQLNCLDPMLYSFHLHFTNREPQKEMKKRRGGKLGYFSLVAFCRGYLSLAVSLYQRSDSG